MLDAWCIFMSRVPLLIEVVLEVLALGVDWIALLPVLVAILEDLADIFLKLSRGGVLVSFHLALDGRQVHGSLDDFEIVGDVVGDRIHGVLECLDKSSPVARAENHTGDHPTAVFKVGLRRQRGAVGRGGVGFALAANRLGAACLLLDHWLDLV